VASACGKAVVVLDVIELKHCSQWETIGQRGRDLFGENGIFYSQGGDEERCGEEREECGLGSDGDQRV
jgi:hypothetical protein